MLYVFKVTGTTREKGPVSKQFRVATDKGLPYAQKLVNGRLSDLRIMEAEVKFVRSYDSPKRKVSAKPQV